MAGAETESTGLVGHAGFRALLFMSGGAIMLPRLAGPLRLSFWLSLLAALLILLFGLWFRAFHLRTSVRPRIYSTGRTVAYSKTYKESMFILKIILIRGEFCPVRLAEGFASV